MRLMLCLAMLLLTALPGWASEPISSVPYRVDFNGWFTVNVEVNGQGPYAFIIDTGANQSLIFENLAALQTFSPTGGEDQRVLGFAKAGFFPPRLIGELQVGELRLENLVSVVLPDWQIENSPHGILGLDFLSRYICVFDANEGVVHFYDRAAPPRGIDRWKHIPLKADNFGLETNPLYTAQARINSRPVRLLLDLGAAGTVINRSAVATVAKPGIELRIGPSGGDASGRITDALQKSAATQRVRVKHLQIGRAHWYRRVLFIHNAEIFNELGVANKPFGLLGADLVRNRSFALDFQGERFLVGPKIKKKKKRRNGD